jgi:hypothetical protein
MGNKNTMTTATDDDYAERAERFGLASKQAIQELLKETPKETIYFLDVRSEAEFTEKQLTGQTNVVYAQCTMGDASKVTETAEEIIPDKSGKGYSSLCENGSASDLSATLGFIFQAIYPLFVQF